MSEKKKPDWTVARVIVIAPPEKQHKVQHVEAQVLVPIRAEFSNLGRNEGSGPGGNRPKNVSKMVPWSEVASQKLRDETGIAVPADELVKVGRFENTVTNPDGQKFLILSHVFLAELAAHPELVYFDKNQTGMLWLNIIDGQLRTDFQNERGETVMTVTLLENTLKMIEKAMRLRKSSRGQQ